ncbi:MAG: hypothetical protein ACT4PE_13080 [Candidatus Eiseniibacteriota bacterium]
MTARGALPIHARERGLTWALLAVWLSVYVAFATGAVREHLPYYRFALSADPETLRRHHSRLDPQTAEWYETLQFCDALLPPGAELQIVLPTEPTYRYEFLRDRARYLLYPRNTGDDRTLRDHILVYGVRDFETPPGYVQVEFLGPNRYLLSRR